MIDAHAHITHPLIGRYAEELALFLFKNGLERIILGGIGPEDWRAQELLLSKYPNNLTACFGIHPWTVQETPDQDLKPMLNHLKKEVLRLQVPLLGETGLDFFIAKSAEQRLHQEHWCLVQLRLAQELNLPVVLHIVKAHDRMIHLLNQVPVAGGIVHGFRGERKLAEKYQSFGLKISLNLKSFRKDPPAQWSWLKNVPFLIESDEPQSKYPVEDSKLSATQWLKSLQNTAHFISEATGWSTSEVWASQKKQWPYQS